MRASISYVGHGAKTNQGGRQKIFPLRADVEEEDATAARFNKLRLGELGETWENALILCAVLSVWTITVKTFGFFSFRPLTFSLIFIFYKCQVLAQK